jgi:negative regulator of flagellin synthesis FlgM
MNRIDGQPPILTGRAAEGRALTPAGDDAIRDGGSERPGGRQDHVSLSDRARLVSLAARAVDHSSDVRAEKVAALKAAIANGSYQADATGVANRLLRGGSFD